MTDMPIIGLYVHHHGSGHATRAKYLQQQLNAEVHILSSATHQFQNLPTHQLISLPSDVPEQRNAAMDFRVPEGLHYAPVRVPEVRDRMLKIADWIKQTHPQLAVVDLSCEITMLMRLFSVPTVLVRLHGYRDDAAHEQAFDSAELLIAPFPSVLEDQHTAEWVKEKTIYTGFFSRYEDRQLSKAAAQEQCHFEPDQQHILLINGMGGNAFVAEQLHILATTYPQWHWTVVGKCETDERFDALPNLNIVGYVEDTFPYLRAADIVVGSAGTNTMMEIAAADARYICLPEIRPFEEQVSKALALEKLGAAVVSYNFPQLEEWTSLIEAAQQLPDDRWKTFRAERNFDQVVKRLEEIARMKLPI